MAISAIAATMRGSMMAACACEGVGGGGARTLQLDGLARWYDADVWPHAVSLGAGGLDLVRYEVLVAFIL
jgi:hypothetical protein